MHWFWLKLPPPEATGEVALADSLNVKIWLADQPQTQPIQMLGALAKQIAAVDAADMAAQQAVEVLNQLRTASIPQLAVIESRFLRKPLPLNAGEKMAFDAVRTLCWKLGLAYFRRATQLEAAQQLLPLQRAAIALRMLKYCHFQAAIEPEAYVDQLLFAVLDQAQSSGLLLQPYSDSDFPHFGESNLAGQLAWTFLLSLIEPYRLSATQLTVANRAISRWRELCEFRNRPSSDPSAHSIDLTSLFGAEDFPAGIPRWLEIRKLTHKLSGRLQALQEGQSPESLKLGRELSAAACIALLIQMEHALDVQLPPSGEAASQIALSFGPSDAYVLIKGERLQKSERFSATSSQIAHQRFEIFGFDQVSQAPDVTSKSNAPSVPSEDWQLAQGQARRRPQPDDTKRQTPSLIAGRPNGKTSLGIMRGMRLTLDGVLSADLDWVTDRYEAGYINSKPNTAESTRIPVFLLRNSEGMSLIAPSDFLIRPGESLFLNGMSIGRVAIASVIERGNDFIHYAAQGR